MKVHKHSRVNKDVRSTMSKITFPFTKCGLVIGRKYTAMLWKKVTCKNCLKHKPEGK